MDMSKVFKSSLGIKYPIFRDYPLHTGTKWLEGRAKDDGTEGYWRIHNELYDLQEFIENHPGGRDWIELTKGTDITEAFESHHLSRQPEQLLAKYFVKKATTPRNFPWTFHDGDFYKTLKRRIMAKMESVPQHPVTRTKMLTDGLFVSYVTTFLFSVYFKSFLLGMMSGLMLSLLSIAAHNYFHQKNNFRRFYFDLTLMSSREWRITHAISHHLYTNTISDMEIASVEPFLQYLPGEKNILFRYGSWIYSPIVYAFLFKAQYVKGLIETVLGHKKFPWTFLLPFTIPFLSWILTGQSLGTCMMMFLWIITIASIHFGVVGLNAAHHHPDIFHDGDAARSKTEMDWGIYQLDAVMDRKDITGSQFLVLTHFGDHALHHLFPTIDHGLLEHLYPVFLETCEQFGIDWRLVTQLDLVKGQFRQLAKTVPKAEPPKHITWKSL